MHDESQPKIDSRPPTRIAALGVIGVMIGSVIAMAPALPGMLSVPKIEPIDLSVMGIITAMETSPEVLTSEPRPGLVAGTDAADSHLPATRRLPLVREQQNVVEFIARKYRIAQDSVRDVVDLAYRTAREHRMDPFLLLAVVSIESSFNPLAQSHKGAQGLMQVLTRVHAEKFEPFGGVEAAFDPVANIKVGARILNEYLAREGSVEGALKSYVGAALRPHDGGYGNKVLGERERIAAAAAGKPVPGGPFGTATEAKAIEPRPTDTRATDTRATETKAVDTRPTEPKASPARRDDSAAVPMPAPPTREAAPIAVPELPKRSELEGLGLPVESARSAIPDAQHTASGG